MGWDWSFFIHALTSPQVVRASWTTIWVAVVAQTIGTVIGVLVAPTMLSTNLLVRAPAWGYRWLFQGTPLLVQILAFFAVLPATRRASRHHRLRITGPWHQRRGENGGDHPRWIDFR